MLKENFEKFKFEENFPSHDLIMSKIFSKS